MSLAMGRTSPRAGLLARCLVCAAAAYLCLHSAGLGPVLTLTDRTSWAWELTAVGYFMKVAQDSKEKNANFYWAKSLLMTAFAAFGGGFMAPLVVAHVPVPLMEEINVWMLLIVWYFTHHAGAFSDTLSDVMSVPVAKCLFSLFYSIFKTQQIVGNFELAARAVAAEELVPPSVYFPRAIAPCLLCGFLGGCGGAFLPLSNGLKAVEEGNVWNMRASFFATLAYCFTTRCLGAHPLSAKMGLCLFRFLGEVFPGPRDAALRPVTSALYRTTGLRSTPLPCVVVPIRRLDME